MHELLAGIGEKFAERRLFALIAPALLFWLAGGLAWVFPAPFTGESRTREALELWEGFGRFDAEEKVLVLVALFLALGLSGVGVKMLNLTVLRFLEGYWSRTPGLKWLRGQLTRRTNYEIARMSDRFQRLAKTPLHALTGEEAEEYARLDARLMNVPSAPQQRMPTALGNTLRAAEFRPREKYGLESTACWPRLWLLLPESAKEDLADARALLDVGASVWTWGALCLVWTAWAWWASLAALLIMAAAYRLMLGAAETYGVLVDSAFDLYRTSLYRSLRWPLPATPADERAAGEALSLYLWRGSDRPAPVFTPPREAAHEAESGGEASHAPEGE